ncbi:MAG: polysaccharide pyruvyl transferase family protein [Clostridia bacterium]|nr:polysaccharide pyruvyl transferase family protein [Clostridia bacterium]
MKIGIITHYYKSKNYGGNLQAYALCKVLHKLGYQAEQISFFRTKNIKCKISDFYHNINILKNLSVYRSLKLRAKAIITFNLNSIPHSKVYTEKNIVNSVNDYDAFITGSDQVWHPSAYCPAYLLDFVPSFKTKISYAASVAANVLPDEVKKKFKESFETFNAISVREESSVNLLKDITSCDVAVTLDPTLLLTKDEWIDISEKHSMKEKYVFCFFLGNDIKSRKLAFEFSKKHNLKIVTLPHLLGSVRNCDINFGDYLLYDVSPGMFLSLIKDAEYVFTDSFHASVFSLIFEKEFFVFYRNGFKSMETRIYSLVDIFEVEEHFCNDERKATMEYIESLSPIEYNKSFEKYEYMKSFSIQYLHNSLIDTNIEMEEQK